MKQGESDPDKCTESRVMYPMSKSVLATPREGALQVKQELYDSDGIVPEC